MSFQYTTKPVTVEAFQYKNSDETRKIPGWFIKACIDGTLNGEAATCYCITKQGPVKVNDGDYLIKLADGEIYPCNEKTFHEKYEALPDVKAA